MNNAVDFIALSYTEKSNKQSRATIQNATSKSVVVLDKCQYKPGIMSVGQKEL